MANQRSGPIRRPTLDLEARRKQAKPDETSPLEHAADEDERDTLDPGEPLPGEDLSREAVEAPQGGMSGADQRFSNPAPPPPQRPWGRRAGPRILLVLGGGVVGLALAYGLALAGLWPDPTDTCFCF